NSYVISFRAVLGLFILVTKLPKQARNIACEGLSARTGDWKVAQTRTLLVKVPCKKEAAGLILKPFVAFDLIDPFWTITKAPARFLLKQLKTRIWKVEPQEMMNLLSRTQQFYSELQSSYIQGPSSIPFASLPSSTLLIFPVNLQRRRDSTVEHSCCPFQAPGSILYSFIIWNRVRPSLTKPEWLQDETRDRKVLESGVMPELVISRNKFIALQQSP
ncbi:hypothetical protein Leryth_008706, partial [Lithospermum erythrorhizon]